MRITAFRNTPAGIGPVLDLTASTVACFMEFFFLSFFLFFFFEEEEEKEASRE